MSGALAGPASCLVCGSTRPPGTGSELPVGGSPDQLAVHRCPTCAGPWWPSRPADGPTLLDGVVRAGVGRRLLAALVDALVPALLVAGGVLVRPGREPLAVLLIVLAVLVLVVEAALVLTTGRSPGRWLTGLRTVDDLTGVPVRVRSLGRLLPTGSRRVRLLSADLRAGRDPLRTRPPVRRTDAGSAELGSDPSPDTVPDQPTRTTDRVGGPDVDRSSTPEPHPTQPSDPEVPGQVAGGPGSAGTGRSTGPEIRRPSVGVVLESGERYDVQQVLFIGRSPVDPQPGPGRMLLAWPDLSRRVARTHVMLEWTGTVLWVTDLESASGTSLSMPDGSRMPLAPGVRFAAGVGSVITCGGRSIRVVPGG